MWRFRRHSHWNMFKMQSHICHLSAPWLTTETNLLACCVCQHVWNHNSVLNNTAKTHGWNLPSCFVASSTKTYLTCTIYYEISKTNTRLKQSLIQKIRWKVEIDGEVRNSARWSQNLEARVIQNFVVLANKSVTWSHWRWVCTLELQFPLTLKSIIKPRHSGRKKNAQQISLLHALTRVIFRSLF